MKYVSKQIQTNVNISKNSPLKEFITLLLILFSICLATYVSLGLAINIIVPHISPEYESKLGNLFQSKYINSEETETLNTQQVLDTLTLQIKAPLHKYKVHVVSENIMNAIALPGGNIIVYTPLLNKMGSENELAFVLAHELGHMHNRDHLKKLGRTLVLGYGSSVIFGKDNYITTIITNSLIKAEMRFSQEQEQQADLYAVDLLNKSYNSVSGSIEFLERISSTR